MYSYGCVIYGYQQVANKVCCLKIVAMFAVETRWRNGGMQRYNAVWIVDNLQPLLRRRRCRVIQRFSTRYAPVFHKE